MTESTAALAAALAKVQAELPKLERDRTVTVEPKDPKKPAYSYSYVTLANLSDAILPLLAKHGLAFTALPGTGSDGKMCLRYHLLHESGEQLSGEFPISGEGGIQMVGGRITYARRYCLAAIVGVAADEDDESRLDDDGPRSTAQRAARPAASTRAREQTAASAAAAGKTAQRATRPATGPPLPGEDAPADSLITKPQLTKLHILMQDTGFTDPTEALAYLSAKADREIASSKELTKQEARHIIDALESLSEGPPAVAEAEPTLDGGDTIYNQHEPPRRAR